MQLNQNNVMLNTAQPKILPSKPDVKTQAIEKAFNILATWEDLNLKAYLCPAGVWTIGYGIRNINGQPVTKDAVITKEQATQYLKDYITQSLEAVWSDVFKCNSNQIAAILSFIYDCGKGNWDKSSLRRAVLTNPNDFQSICIEFRKWVYIKGERSEDSINRREAEIKLYCSGNA